MKIITKRLGGGKCKFERFLYYVVSGILFDGVLH